LCSSFGSRIGTWGGRRPILPGAPWRYSALSARRGSILEVRQAGRAQAATVTSESKAERHREAQRIAAGHKVEMVFDEPAKGGRRRGRKSKTGCSGRLSV